MLRGANELIEDLRQPGGGARQRLLTAINQFGEDMVSIGPESGVGPPLLRDPQLRAWIAISWQRARDLLLAELEPPAPRIARALALMIVSIGDTLRRDGAMCERVDLAVEMLVIEALPWREEVIRFVTAVMR